jgi:acetolactate synthase I/II/III large subunit
MTASEEELSIIFIIWNNNGYLEIEKSMAAAQVEVAGCDLPPPEFAAIAKACNIRYVEITGIGEELSHRTR